MRTFETLDAVREMAWPGARAYKIGHRTDGEVYIIAEYVSVKAIQHALKCRPNPDILEVLSGHSLRTDAEQAELDARKVKITLSTRGWGDYSPLTWTGDIRRPDADIVTECENLIKQASSVDSPPNADKITELIAQARGRIEATAKVQSEQDDKIEAAKAKARETGNPVEIEAWVTNDCRNNNDDECSCDRAIKTVDADGEINITYTCCY